MFQSKFLFTGGIPYPDISSSSSVPNFDFVSSWPSDPMPIAAQWYHEAEAKFFSLTNGVVSETQQWPNTIQISTIGLDGAPKVRTVLLKGLDSRGFIFFTNYNGGKGRELTNNPNCSIVIYWKYLEKQLRVEGRVERLSPELSDAYFHSRPFGSQLGGIASPQSSAIPSHAALEWHYVNLVKQATKFLLQKAAVSNSPQAMDKAQKLIAQYLPEFSEEISKAVEMKEALPKMLELKSFEPSSVSSNGSDAGLPVIDEAVHSLHSRCLSVLTQFDSDADLSVLAKGILKRPDHWGGFRLVPSKMEFWQDGMFRLHSRITYSKQQGQDDKWEKTFLSP